MVGEGINHSIATILGVGLYFHNNPDYPDYKVDYPDYNADYPDYSVDYPYYNVDSPDDRQC